MKSDQWSFHPGVFLCLFLPYLGLSFLVAPRDMDEAIIACVVVLTLVGTLLFVLRHRRALLEGLVGALLLFALLSACAFIPVIGWIFDVFMFIYAVSSALAALKMLVPRAARALVFWGIFVGALHPSFHHPIFSTLGYLVCCLIATRALSKMEDPFGELLLIATSIPLLMIIIASLGRLFRNSVGTARIGVSQNVSGYTTRAGVHVDAYTRTVTKTVTTVSTTINPGAVVTNTAAAASLANQRDGEKNGQSKGKLDGP